MKHSLKKRFHAWWEGYDLPSEMEGLTALEGGLGEETAQTDTLTAASDPNTLSADRLDFLQLLWGEGYVRPGTRALNLSLAKPLLVQADDAIAEFGGGLGSFSRALGAETSAFVDSFETDALLVEASSGLKATAEEKKFATLSCMTAGNVPEGRSYDKAVFNRYLHRLDDPIDMLGEVKQLMKPGGVFLLNEYTAGEKGILPDATQAMMDGFSAPRALIGRDVYCTALEELGFEVRVKENRAEEHLQLIADGWTAVDKCLVEDPGRLDLNIHGTYLSQETARWAAISSALREGQMDYSRILAILPS